MHLEIKQTWSEELGLCITSPGAYSLFTFPSPVRLSLLLLPSEITSVENCSSALGFSHHLPATALNNHFLHWKNKMENLRSWWKGKIKVHHHMPISKYPDVIPFSKPFSFFPMSSQFSKFHPWLSSFSLPVEKLKTPCMT